MPKIWFSYSLQPHMSLDGPEPNRNPYARTWHVGRYLRSIPGYDFQYVNLDDTGDYDIGPDDIVIGHPWYGPETAFIEKAFEADCKARIIIQPYAIRMVGDEALSRLHALWGKADKIILNTGPYWFDTMADTQYAEYLPRCVRIDNATNPALHPFHKRTWNKPGGRAVLAIGHDAPVKGLDALAELARVAGFKLGHYGSANVDIFKHVPQIKMNTGRAFDEDAIKELCAEYDFFFTMGRADANPTTLLETACWGLIGACTKECGYWPNQPFLELRHGDMVHNLELVERLQTMSEYDLNTRAHAMRAAVAHHFTWQRVVDTVAGVVNEHLA